MEVKVPILHQHILLFDAYYNETIEATCDKCHLKIYGQAYNCESCKFWLHDSCAEQKLPPQISHPAHSQHLLTLSLSNVRPVSVCDICFTLCKSHVYTCKDCNFKLDLLCASNTNVETSGKESQRSDHDRYKDFKHFIHEHPLTLFKYRKVEKDEYSCLWCGKFLSGMCYGCFHFRCSPNFFIHQSCLLKIPFKIIQHPFHPSHPLSIQETQSKSESRCNACAVLFMLEEDAYVCRKCDFNLHVLCARLQPSLKRDVHEHTLTYIPKTKTLYNLQPHICKKCHQKISAPAHCITGNFYRCVPCNINFHLKCVPIPRTIKHRYHRHHLKFIDLFTKNPFGEYYCDICEEERDSNYPIYYCKECTYVSHIPCALNSQVDNRVLMISKTTWEEESDRQFEAESQTDQLELEYTQIEVLFHKHLLCFYEVNEKEELKSCQACGLKICSRGYACKTCYYYLHETCTKLPHKILHPLHPQHSLNFLANTSEKFTCLECRSYQVKGFGYVCYQCNFKLDVKCTLNLTTPAADEDQRLKRMKRLSKCCLFNQAHKLEVRVYDSEFCKLCFLPLMGPIFHCKLCPYDVHESCLELIPRKIEIPIHPAHLLHLELYIGRFSCLVCGTHQARSDIIYRCQNCPDLRLHFPCANSLKRAIIVKGSVQSHEHYLFYFGAKWQPTLNRMKFQKCDKCCESLSGMAFFHCLMCSINLHLRCVPIPHLIKSKCHIHPLVLKDQYVEDDLGEYYCDVCEEERQPDGHVYFCEQCAFVAHIECVLKQAEENTLQVETYSNLEIDVEKLPYPRIPYQKLF